VRTREDSRVGQVWGAGGLFSDIGCLAHRSVDGTLRELIVLACFCGLRCRYRYRDPMQEEIRGV